MTANDSGPVVPATAESAIEIAPVWLGSQILDNFPNHHRNMRKHNSVTRAVTLPVVVKALDRILQGSIILEKSIHTDDLEDIAQKRTHAGQFKIAIEIA